MTFQKEWICEESVSSCLNRGLLHTFSGQTKDFPRFIVCFDVLQERNDIAAAQACLAPALKLSPSNPLLTRAAAWFATRASDISAAESKAKDLSRPSESVPASGSASKQYSSVQAADKDPGSSRVKDSATDTSRAPRSEPKVFEGPLRGSYYETGPARDMTHAPDFTDLAGSGPW
jgi:hypothetical protein